VDVLGLTSGVIQISSGNSYTCAVTNTGAAYCWGDNWRGQLGNGTYNSFTIPVNVSGLSSGVSAIYTGDYFTCAIQYSRAKCWGENSYGQLGTGNIDWSTVPVDATVLGTDISGIAVGYSYTCVLLSSTKGIKCWGDQEHGQLGNGTISFSTLFTPVDVIGLLQGASSIQSSNNSTSCAILNGASKCWGQNTNGQLGNGSTGDSAVPADVFGLSSGISSISTGLFHTCALTNSDSVKCWGLNSSGQLGDGTSTDNLLPVSVIGLPKGKGISKISAGGQHTCALFQNGSIMCWGENWSGQLGNGQSGTYSKIPVLVYGSGTTYNVYLPNVQR